MKDQFDIEDETFDDETPQKVSLKQLWQDNPLFKIVVIVGGVISAYVAYSVFTGGDGVEIEQSRLRKGSEVTAVPGEGEVDPATEAAIRAADAQRLEEAASTGGSVMPTPIGSRDIGIEVPEIQATEEEDPLKVWRVRNEARDIHSLGDENNQGAVPPSAEDPFAANLQPIQPLQGQIQPGAPQPTGVSQASPEAVNALAEQMRVIIATKQPQPASVISTEFPSLYRQYLSIKESQNYQAAATDPYASANTVPVSADGTAGEGISSTSTTVDEEVILAAGTVNYAQTLTAVNSDIDAPVLVHILSGPFSGGRAIGSFQLQEDYLVLKFDKVVKDDIVYSADAYALDADTTLGGVRTDVNRHWLRRVILPAAAEFIAGVGEAIAETNTTSVSVDGGAAVSSQEELDTQEEAAKGIERGAEKLSEILDENQGPTVTVSLKKGTPLGLLFVESITTGDKD